MEGNKDEAARCVKIAESALASGDKQRAIKFIKIAQRLDPSLRVDDILTASEKLDSSNSTYGQDDIILEQVQRETKSAKESGTSNGERIYTEENVRLIQEVKKNKDYYAILGVEKSCSVEEVRKAYRKLSLKVHPDKNKAPGAEEAFKSVCKAFKCLSDEQSRRHYDQVGVTEDHDFNQQHVNVMRRRRRRATKNDFFDDDFDPDDIFRSFFFGTQGDVFRAQVQRARGMRGHQREHNVEGGVGYGFIKFLQVVPILLFFLFAFLPLWEPEYSLQKTYTYQIPKVTEKLGVEYFVKKEDFDQRFPQESSSRNNLEHHVLRDYKSILGRYCHMELQRRHWAKNYPTPHCDKLRSLAVA